MKDKRHFKTASYQALLPLFGCVLFVLLYVVATTYYPGGNQVDRNAKGFSWAQNYWCNLLNENSINGAHNPARSIALSAMAVLAITLIIFWYLFPMHAHFKKTSRLIIQLSGLLAMVIGVFVFTSFHDIIINIASLFGVVALAGTFVGLRKLKWIRLFRMGVFTIAFMGVNNLFYYTPGLLFYLPVVQKITFLYFLTWISLISISLYDKRENSGDVLQDIEGTRTALAAGNSPTPNND